MAGSEDSRETVFEDTRSDLTAGLRSCRAVLRNYRELLTDGPSVDHPHPPADNDDIN